MHHHAGLAEGEGDEDADDVELNKLGQICLEGCQDHDGGQTESNHTVGVDEAVTAGFESLGCVTVLGQYGTQKGEAVEGGVCSK